MPEGSRKSTPESRRRSTFQAFIIRAWQESGARGAPDGWRFRIQELSSGDQRGFADLEALFDFFRRAFSDQEE
jgi:hypothetical protein